MKKIITLSFIVLHCICVQAQTYKNWVRIADSCYTAKRYELSVSYYEKAFKIEQKDQSNLYNAACSAAMANEEKKAFKWLNLAINNGYDGIAHMKIDGDLKVLQTNKEWQKTVDKLQKKLDILEINYDKPLQKELLAIYTEDQGVRHDYMKIYKANNSKTNKQVDSIGKVMQYKDSVNLLKVMKILDEKGWVGKDVVGSQANQTLFLVIQHADLKYQQKYLPMMREAAKIGNAKPSALAYLEDRVALREGNKQIYGSQILTNPITKKNFIAPLEDPDNVDKRRAKVGLGLLAEYAQKSDIVWNIEAYKKELPEIMELMKKKK